MEITDIGERLGLLIPGSDGRMWSGESEAHKSRSTSDNNRTENLAAKCEWRRTLR